jgi:cytochrome c oxidase assembly protein subunit 15
MVFAIVVIGGITRLTESGLSITEWKPVSGIVPPLSGSQWDAEFASYRQTTEFQQLNAGMSLNEFKRIYFWEYLHRLWGRLVGIVFAAPFFYMLLRGWLSPGVRPGLWFVRVRISLQGGRGWYMVQSGLTGRTDVSPERLTAPQSLSRVL